jgi:alanine racemase
MDQHETHEIKADETPAPRAATAAAGPKEAEAGGVLTIDLGAVVENWRALGRAATPAECGAVVKGDAYGCGLAPVTAALAKAGCRTFFVAQLSEGIAARAAAPDATIYVLNGLVPDCGPVFAAHNLQPVIGNLPELAEWDSFVTIANWRGGAALHVDTGMNRLGFTPDEAAALAPRLQSENHGLTLLMSHFASSEEIENPINERQMKLFRDIRILFRGLPSSLANSSGIYLGNAAHCDLVRPGVALYGANPRHGRENPMRPVVDLKARIMQVRTVSKGQTVGYGMTWTAKRASRIAIVSAGYADGLPRALSASDGKPGGEALVAGKRCEFAGRVSMDLLAVDITDLPENMARRGDFVTLIGGDITIDEVAERAGAIPYEVLTGLGRRYARIYSGG